MSLSGVILTLLCAGTYVGYGRRVAASREELANRLDAHRARLNRESWRMPPLGHTSSCDAVELVIELADEHEALLQGIAEPHQVPRPPRAVLDAASVERLRAASHCDHAWGSRALSTQAAHFAIGGMLPAAGVSGEECVAVAIDAARLSTALAARGPHPTTAWLLRLVLGRLVACAGDVPESARMDARAALYDLIVHPPPLRWDVEESALDLGYGALSRLEVEVELFRTSSLNDWTAEGAVELVREIPGCLRGYDDGLVLAREIDACSDPVQCLRNSVARTETWSTCDTEGVRSTLAGSAECMSMLRGGVLALDVLAQHRASHVWAPTESFEDPLLRQPQTGAGFELDATPGDVAVTWSLTSTGMLYSAPDLYDRRIRVF